MLGLAACNATTATKPDAPVKAKTKIEVEDAVGFTIVEDSRIGSSARGDYDTAMAYLRQGRHAEGIDILEALVLETAELTAPRIDLGIAYHESGDLTAAREHLEAAVAASPSHPVAHNELGIVYRKLGRFDDARRSYEAALAVFPNYHFARRNLAVLCDLYLADLTCALDNYQAYMNTVPADEEAAMWIADIQYRMGNQAP
jgi:Flp pilus assembly protein TadD